MHTNYGLMHAIMQRHNFNHILSVTVTIHEKPHA